jgi:RHS repeat-associated protein
MNTFQDQEYEQETGWVKFKWRNHQPEIGRFFNVDPLAEDYYYNSPYAFSENKVVAHIELEGLESADIKTTINDTQFLSGKIDKDTYVSRRNAGGYGALAGAAIVFGAPYVASTAKALFSSSVGQAGTTGAIMSGAIEATSNPNATTESIATSTASGFVGGMVIGATPSGNFWKDFAGGIVAGAAEETTKQLVEVSTGQRDNIATDEIVKAASTSGAFNATGGLILNATGLSNPNSTKQVVAKKTGEFVWGMLQNESNNALKRKEESNNNTDNNCDEEECN